MGWKSETATIRSVHGSAQASIGGGPVQPLRPNMPLTEGATIQTGADSAVDLQVNGRTSTVRMTADTTMTLKTMKTLGEDSETMLDLKVGTLLGSVKKISNNSKYELRTPRGVTRVRGGGFAVSCVPQPNGTPKVSFTCVTGQLLCVGIGTMIYSSNPPLMTLTSGQSWTPPDNNMQVTPVVPAPPEILRSFASSPLGPFR